MRRLLSFFKDKLNLIGVYSIPCSSEAVYIGETGSLRTHLLDHQRLAAADHQL